MTPLTKLARILFAWLITISLLPAKTLAQLPAKETNHQLQAWTSVNSTLHLSDKWGLMADFHIRRNHFVSDPSFYFLRLGANYWVKQKLTLAAGYAHMWLAPLQPGWSSFSNENRLYQQALLSTALNKTSLLLRVRNEQRWREIMANDAPTGDWGFVNRVRFLTSFSFPLTKQAKNWRWVVANEVLLNFGKQVVYNTFDQNRLFLGVRQKLSEFWAYDFGYMHLYQQRPSGYQYDVNHTVRLFFYYNPDFRKRKTEPRQVLDSREE